MEKGSALPERTRERSSSGDDLPINVTKHARTISGKSKEEREKEELPSGMKERFTGADRPMTDSRRERRNARS